jgi:hypothetical protein
MGVGETEPARRVVRPAPIDQLQHRDAVRLGPGEARIGSLGGEQMSGESPRR